MCKVILHGTTCNKPLLATTLVSATQHCVGTTFATIRNNVMLRSVPMLCCTKIVIDNRCLCNIVLTRCLFTHSMVWLPLFGHQDADTQQLLIIYSMLVQILTPLTRWEKPTNSQSRIMLESHVCSLPRRRFYGRDGKTSSPKNACVRGYMSADQIKGIDVTHQGQFPTPDS